MQQYLESTPKKIFKKTTFFLSQLSILLQKHYLQLPREEAHMGTCVHCPDSGCPCATIPSSQKGTPPPYEQSCFSHNNKPWASFTSEDTVISENQVLQE